MNIYSVPISPSLPVLQSFQEQTAPTQLVSLPSTSVPATLELTANTLLQPITAQTLALALAQVVNPLLLDLPHTPPRPSLLALLLLPWATSCRCRKVMSEWMKCTSRRMDTGCVYYENHDKHVFGQWLQLKRYQYDAMTWPMVTTEQWKTITNCSVSIKCLVVFLPLLIWLNFIFHWKFTHGMVKWLGFSV